MTEEKILVVDDEKTIVDLVKRVLKQEGFKVITAFNGREALEKVYSEAPDLMILDIIMPYMNGYEVCKEIRHDPLYKYLPIIMLTVERTRINQIKGLDLGADEYITKPFDIKEFLTKVKTIFRRQ